MELFSLWLLVEAASIILLFGERHMVQFHSLSLPTSSQPPDTEWAQAQQWAQLSWEPRPNCCPTVTNALCCVQSLSFDVISHSAIDNWDIPNSFLSLGPSTNCVSTWNVLFPCPLWSIKSQFKSHCCESPCLTTHPKSVL